jgi:hypothetical protein
MNDYLRYSIVKGIEKCGSTETSSDPLLEPTLVLGISVL